MKVVIIDDQPAMHLIMQRMLEKMSEVEIIGSFRETEPAFSFLTQYHVDIVFIDIHMPRENGLELAKRIRTNGMRMKIVFVTSYKEYALDAFDVYAYDYITKPISQKRLQGTILRALFEQINHEELSSVENPLPDQYPLMEQITKRELEVLQLISRGLSNKEIALEFGLTEGTVKNHILNIFGKLQVKNRVQAVAVAKELKLIHSSTKKV
jgi:DNA-binding NarL/FixJ family response regulator